MTDFGGRVILGIANDNDSASKSFDCVALRYVGHGVVGTFGVKVGADFANDGAHVDFRENNHGIHVCQGCEDFGAFFGRHNGPAFALQCPHGSVGVYGDNQFAAEFAGSMEVADMADMEDVETSVSEGYAIASAPPLVHKLRELVARNNLRMK